MRCSRNGVLKVRDCSHDPRYFNTPLSAVSGAKTVDADVLRLGDIK